MQSLQQQHTARTKIFGYTECRNPTQCQRGGMPQDNWGQSVLRFLHVTRVRQYSSPTRNSYHNTQSILSLHPDTSERPINFSNNDGNQTKRTSSIRTSSITAYLPGLPACLPTNLPTCLPACLPTHLPACLSKSWFNLALLAMVVGGLVQTGFVSVSFSAFACVRWTMGGCIH